MTPERLATIREMADTAVERELLAAYDALASGSAVREMRVRLAEAVQRAGDAEEQAAKIEARLSSALADRAGDAEAAAEADAMRAARVTRERDELRSTVESMQDALRYGEEVCAGLVKERDEARQQLATVRAQLEAMTGAVSEWNAANNERAKGYTHERSEHVYAAVVSLSSMAGHATPDPLAVIGGDGPRKGAAAIIVGSVVEWPGTPSLWRVLDVSDFWIGVEALTPWDAHVPKRCYSTREVLRLAPPPRAT